MDSFDQRIKPERKLPNKHPNKKDDLIKTLFSDCPQKFCIKNSQSSRLIRLTCEGNLNDKNFPSKLKNILSKLKIILSDGKNLIKVTKVEPWNSVRVTLNLSDDAAQQLRHLAEHGDENLREIGILSVQLDGQQVISLNLPNSNVTTNIQHNNNERRSIQNNDDNQNVNTDKIGQDFDGNSPRQIKETESLDHHHHQASKYQQFDRINGAAIDENSDGCSIITTTTTNTSTSFEPGGGGGALSSMMVVMNDDCKNNNNVPVNPLQPNSSFSNQKSSNAESTSAATTSMDRTDDVSHHFGSHQQHKISSLNTFVKNDTLVNYVANSSDDNCNNHNDNNNNNNHQNTSDVQDSWHNRATIKDPTESTINSCLSNLRISCQTSSIGSMDTIPEKFHTNSSSSSLSSANTMVASNIIRTNTDLNQPPGNDANMMVNQMQSTNALSSQQKLVPAVVSSFKMHQAQTMIKHESPSDSVASESNADLGNNDNSADNLRNDAQLLHQIKSSNSYQPQSLQISQQQGPPQQQQQQQNISSNQVQATNNCSSSDILGSSIDAVDDDLLDSVVTAGGADPNDFTDLSDLSWLEIDNTTNNSNRNLNQQTSTTPNSSSTTTASSSDDSTVSSKSSISIQMNSSNLVATSTANVARIHQQENKTTSNLMSVPMNSLPYFLHQQKPSQQQQQPQQQQQQFSTKMVNTLPTNVMGSNQSILINSTNNPNQSAVLTSTSATSSTNNNSSNNNNLNQSNASISTGTSTTTIFPFTSLQNSGIRLQQPPPPLSSSPRHIYVPARTQQSWPTASTGSPQQQSSQQPQTPPSTPPTVVANQKRYNQQQQQASTPTSGDVNMTQSSPAQQQQQQQQPTRFVTINSNGNGSFVRQPSSTTQLSLANQINNNGTIVNQNKPQQQQMNQPQQILVRSSGNSGTGGGGGGSGVGSFPNNQQQQSSSSNLNSGTQQQNAVALSSPLLVNLLQSDVTSPFQPLNSAAGNSGHTQQQQQQQQQFLNQSGTRQIRFITHGSNDHSEGSTPVMMMVQVSSSGHQGTQIINPVTANMVSVAKTALGASSNVAQQQQHHQQQRAIEQSSGSNNNDNNNNNNNGMATNKPAKKPRKPRKSKNQTENRMADSSVQTSGGGGGGGGGGDCLSSNASHPSQTPTNFVTMTNIGSIPITSNTDMSARIQTSSVSTFITVPTSSMAQSIVKLQQQQQQPISSNNGGGNVQQSILSSPNSSGGAGHAIFNQKSRVQPVVMIAANSASMDVGANSSVASQAPTIVSSAGGTFILANMNSLNVNSSSPITSTTANTSGVQMSGARKQIFLATKSNSFPVSSALSAGAIVARFANNPTSSTPTLVSSPVKLVSQQQQQQSSNNSLTMSPNELRNMSAPATPQQQQQASLLSTPIKSSPSPVMASPIQTSSLPINANLIPNSPSSLSSSSTSSTSSQATNNSNLFANASSSSSSSNNNNNNNNMLQTLNTVVSMASSPMKTTKSSHNSEQYLLAPSPSTNSSNNSQQQQQQQSNNPQFKNFQIPKATPTSLLLNKLNQTNQQQQQQILAAISAGNMSANTCGKISQFKPVPHVVANVQKQFLTGGGNNDDHNANQVAMENSFVLKQIKTSLAGSHVPSLVDNNDRLQHQQKNREAFVQVTTGQHNQKIVPSNLNPISNFKQSLADMLANTGENSASSDKIVSGFLENDPEKISEPTAPISPSYFLAPASAFDMQTKCEKPNARETKNEELVGQDGLVEPKTMDSVVDPNHAKDTSDPKIANITSKTFSLTAIVTSCAGTVTNATLSPLITATGLESNPFTSRTENVTATSSKKNYDSFDVSQDLPDNILDDDDDEEDGSDSDDDEFCFFAKRKSHFLSGSIGSIGGSGGGGGNSNSNTPKKSEPNAEPPNISGGLIQKSYHPTKDTEPMSQSSSTVDGSIGKDEKPSTVQNETLLKTEDGSIKSNQMTNGDLSQDSSNADDDSKPGMKQSLLASSSLPPLLPPGSCQMPIITPIIAKSETITKTTVDAPSSIGSNDFVKSSKTSILNESVKVTTTAMKNRRISPPTGGSAKSATKPARRKTISSLEKPVVSVPTTPAKTGQPMFVASTSAETTKMTSPNPTEKLVHNEIPNNELSPNKKSLFILKHPQAISSAGGIQLSNTNQTLAQYLQADGSTVSANSTASVIASSSSSSSSTPSSSPTPSTSAPNQKLKLVCFGPNKYISLQPNTGVQGTISDANSSGVLYRVPGAGKQFVVLKQMMVNDSGNTIKLISNNPNLKLPTSVAGPGTSQSVFIPMVSSTASNNNTLLSVKPTTAQIITSNDILSGVNNSQTMEASGDTKLVTKKMNIVRSCSLPNVPVAPGSIQTVQHSQIQNVQNSSTTLNEVFNVDANDRNTSDALNTLKSENKNSQINTDSNADTMSKRTESLPETSSSRMDEKAERTKVVGSQQDSGQMKKPETNQNDPTNASVKSKENVSLTSAPIQRTVHIMQRSGNDLAAAAASSNLMILKADGSRISATTTTTDNKDLAGLGRSNSPNAGIRRPILITKSVPYNPLNISQPSMSHPAQDGSSTSMAIFATKSNNNTVTATKTLPTILRQSKRKNDHTHSSSSATTTQTISIAMEPPATTKTIFDGSGVGQNDSSEADSESAMAFRQQQQQQQKFQTFASNDDETISDVSDSIASRPKKRARKSKITSLPQTLIGDSGGVFLNVEPISLDRESASQGDNHNEPETPGNSGRVLRNSITSPSASKPKPTTPKRVQRNTNKAQSSTTTTSGQSGNDVPLNPHEMHAFLTRASVANLVKPSEKIIKVRKTPPRRARAKNQPELSAVDHQMIDTNPTETETFAASSSSSPSSSSDAVTEIHQSASMPNQTGGSLIAKNMVLPTIITSDGSLVARSANCVRTGTMSSFVSTQQINVLSVPNTTGSGEHYVSLLDNSINNSSSSNNGNNSLLVKRPRKSLQPASTVRPSLRNIVASETTPGSASSASSSSSTTTTAAVASTAAPSTPSPNKRRRLAKDVAK